MTGRSKALDPRTHAVRGDLADIRLAEYVFAPHYVAPLERQVSRETPLRSTRDAQSEVVATLAAGEIFEVLEFAGGQAWGIAPAEQLVGYLSADALTPA